MESGKEPEEETGRSKRVCSHCNDHFLGCLKIPPSNEKRKLEDIGGCNERCPLSRKSWEGLRGVMLASGLSPFPHTTSLLVVLFYLTEFVYKGLSLVLVKIAFKKPASLGINKR